MTAEMRATGIDRIRQLGRKLVRNARDKNKWRKVVKVRLWMPVVLQILLIMALLWYTSTRFNGFINQANILNILLLAMPLSLAAIAQTHAILVGYLDLSVGAMISFGVVAGSFLMGADASAGQIALAIPVILGCGVGLGLVNAGLIRGFRIPSLIATLATLSILDGISLTLRPSAQGVISGDLVSVLTKRIGPIPIAFVVIVIGAVLLDVWLHASGSGLAVRAVGFDERAAKRGGIPTNWIRVRALILSSLLAAVAAFFVMARSPIGNPQIGSPFALNSITAAVLGGASLAGGRATFVGSTVASILLALIISVLPFLGLSPDDGSMIIGLLVLIGIVLFQVGDLKELVKRNFRRARRLVLGSGVVDKTEIPAFYPQGTDFAVVPTGRKLIKNGIMLTLDQTIGDLLPGDVLIEDDRHRPGGPRRSNVDGAEVIDATGMIVMPGFIDTHRHIWEGLLRNIGTDVPLEGRTSYISFVLHKLAPAFRPEDAYVGDLLSALGAIDAGVTTLLDWSHIQGSPAHTDAVVQALNDSGMRAVFAYGFPWWGKWEERQPSWFVRAATEHFSTTGPEGDAGPGGPRAGVHRLRSVPWITGSSPERPERESPPTSGVGSYGLDAKVQEMGEAGLLGPDTTYIHCTTLNDTEIQMIVDTGGTVSLASPVEMMMGHGMPPIQKFLDRGLHPSLSVDVETNVPSDMFNQMRSMLGLQRNLAAASGRDPISARDVVSYATLRAPGQTGSTAEGGNPHPGQEGRPDPAAHRPDQRLSAQRPGDRSRSRHGHGQCRHGDHRRADHETQRKAAARRLAGLRSQTDESRDHVIAKSGFRLPKI